MTPLAFYAGFILGIITGIAAVLALLALAVSSTGPTRTHV